MSSWQFSCLTLSSEHLVGFCCATFSDSDTRVKVERKNTVRQGLLLLFWLFICWFSSFSKSEYNHVYFFTNTLCVIFSLKTNYIWPNIFFLKFTKATKEHTHVLSIRLSRQVHGLSNHCTFALASSLAGRFISRYWVSLIDFGLRPSRELVCHLSTQLNNGLLAV